MPFSIRSGLSSVKSDANRTLPSESRGARSRSDDAGVGGVQRIDGVVGGAVNLLILADVAECLAAGIGGASADFQFHDCHLNASCLVGWYIKLC